MVFPCVTIYVCSCCQIASVIVTAAAVMVAAAEGGVGGWRPAAEGDLLLLLETSGSISVAIHFGVHGRGWYFGQWYVWFAVSPGRVDAADVSVRLSRCDISCPEYSKASIKVKTYHPLEIQSRCDAYRCLLVLFRIIRS